MKQTTSGARKSVEYIMFELKINLIALRSVVCSSGRDGKHKTFIYVVNADVILMEWKGKILF